MAFVSERTPFVVPSGIGALSVRRPVWSYRWWALSLSVVAGLCIVHVIRPDGLPGQTTYLLVAVGAAVVAWFGVGRMPAQRRFPWRCVAVAVSLSAIGDAIFYVLGLVDGALNDVSVADGFWVAAYVALAVGLSSLIVGGHGGRRVDIDGLIDIGSFAVLAVLVVTQFTVVHDLMFDVSYSVSTRMIWTAYPILDAALLGVFAQALISRRLRGRSGLFVLGGVTLWLISDLASLLITDAAGVFKWLDVGWMLGATSLAVSAWPARLADPVHMAAFKTVRVTEARIFITLLPLLVPGAIAIRDSQIGRSSSPELLFGATVTLVVLAFARSARLVKARNRQEQALERSTHFYEAALAANSSDAVIVVDAEGRILNEAPNLINMLGRVQETTIGMDVIDLLRPADQTLARTVLDHWRLTDGVVADTEVQATRADGSARWFGVRAANFSTDPVVGGVVINLRDITDRKRAEQQLSHSAFHDSLTGLANRALFHDRLVHALERSARSGLRVAVVYLDLDGFKTINDSQGHEAGDRVLREVAIRLSSVIRAVDTVSRHGGDEFAILIEESARALDEAETVAGRILAALTAPIIVDGQQVVLSASIGIAIGDNTGTASSMMRDADVAMYKAKTTGKSKWVLYEPAMRATALDRLELDIDLRNAVDEGQLRLVYQPVIELESNKVVGFEALLRWDHPTRGVIEPLVFIPIAESNGTIVAIGQWVLEQACATAARWQHLYPAAQLTMSVNVSGRQIGTPGIVTHVAEALEHSGLEPDALILEITESVLVHDPNSAALRLQQLRALGVRLAIDDFGTGYSSLAYLRQFPIDVLKIDKSFIDGITDRSQVPAIVRGLLDLAKTLRLKSVAEGIELDVQLESLRDEQCEFGQGFLFAKPLDVDDAAALLAERNSPEPMPIGSF
jgi:diguanylate cyclase (GGDEF)-like protein/PAS domain S-box-containing protein